MSKHSKIPMPDGKRDSKVASSMIERVVNAFDLRRMAPPPVPRHLPEQGANRLPTLNTPRRDGSRLPNAQFSGFQEPASKDFSQDPLQFEPQNVSQTLAHENSPREAARFSEREHKIDREFLREQGMIVPEGSVTALLEEFRIIKRHILVQAIELRRLSGGANAAAQRVLVCSPLPGEGKTYCSVNLALSIAAEKESEVLLVDADFAKPSVLSTLGLPGGAGLMDALSDPSIDVADLVLTTDIPGLRVLPAGNATNSDSEFLRSSRTASVLDRLTEGAPHRVVIFDSPPALAASPAAELAKYVGQALVVARADRTGQGALEDAISLLSACPNIELLLNAANFSPSGRRFGSYYGYRG